MSKQSSQRVHRVAALVDEGSNPFELGCMTEVFGIDRPELGGPLYDFGLCARGGSATMRRGLFTMSSIADLSLLEAADTVIVPNRPDTATPHHPEVLAAIRGAHQRGARLIGMCSGAFTIAETGLLSARRATVHWRWADEFRARFPDVDLDEDVLFIDDGDILTSAGSAAALDLGLYVVRADHGAEVDTAVARRLVFAAHRPGGQRQFIDRPIPQGDPGSLAAVADWAEEHATEPITLADLARQASVSIATLHRRWMNEMGCTPGEWLSGVRVDHARRLLEGTRLSVEEVARDSGLGTATNLRVRLRARTGLTPTAYRRQYTRVP